MRSEHQRHVDFLNSAMLHYDHLGYYPASPEGWSPFRWLAACKQFRRQLLDRENPNEAS